MPKRRWSQEEKLNLLSEAKRTEYKWQFANMDFTLGRSLNTKWENLPMETDRWH